MSLFVCPICGAALEREPGRYRCPAGHPPWVSFSVTATPSSMTVSPTTP